MDGRSGCFTRKTFKPSLNKPNYIHSGLALVKQGAQNRRNAATKLNLDSSRSHSVFTIELVASADGGEGCGGSSGKQQVWSVCPLARAIKAKKKASALFCFRSTSCRNRMIG